MTSKERANLKGQAMKLESIFQIGKTGVTPQMVDALRDALKARELIKINVLKSCDDGIPELARILSDRTGAEIVQTIGRKIILYKKNQQKEEKKKAAIKRELIKKTQKKVMYKENKNRRDKKTDRRKISH